MVTSCCRAVIISRFSFFRFTTPFSPLFNFFLCASTSSWILICSYSIISEPDGLFNKIFTRDGKKDIYDKLKDKILKILFSRSQKKNKLPVNILFEKCKHETMIRLWYPKKNQNNFFKKKQIKTIWIPNSQFWYVLMTELLSLLYYHYCCCYCYCSSSSSNYLNLQSPNSNY